MCTHYICIRGFIIKENVILISLALTVPSRVSGVSVTKTVESGTSALIVNWTTPQSDVAISRYQVQYRRSGTTFWSSQVTISGSPPATSTILTGLDAGTEYNIRVRAVSELGDGKWSVEQTERTFDSELLCIIYIIYHHLNYMVYTYSIISVIIWHSVPVNLLCCSYTSASAWHMYIFHVQIRGYKGKLHFNISSSDSSLKSQWCFYDQDSGIWVIISEGDLGHSPNWCGHLWVPGAVQKKWDNVLEQCNSPLRLTSCNVYCSAWTGCWHWIQH